jgi:hypothetical protein
LLSAVDYDYYAHKKIAGAIIGGLEKKGPRPYRDILEMPVATSGLNAGTHRYSKEWPSRVAAKTRKEGRAPVPAGLLLPHSFLGVGGL